MIDCPQVPVLECDDEKALKMAMALALNFPSAPRPTCTRHLKQNFSHALADKVGLTKQEQDFTGKIFGDNGVIVYAIIDYVDIAEIPQHMTEKIENVSVQKIILYKSPLLVENEKDLERPGLHVASPLWTIVKA